jgi:hypothetical protein
MSGTEDDQVVTPEDLVVQEPTVVEETNVDEIVSKKIAEALKPIKANLDKAYEARDKALEKIKEFEKLQRDAEIARLQEDGKHREAYELQLKEEKALREAAEKQIVQLTRDNQLRSALTALDFRNESASEMAYRELSLGLVRNERGEWVSSSGQPIKDFVRDFADKKDNAFLFKQRVSTGSGARPVTASSSETKPKSVFAMSQEEVIKLAEEGKLRRR